MIKVGDLVRFLGIRNPRVPYGSIGEVIEVRFEHGTVIIQLDFSPVSFCTGIGLVELVEDF